MPRYLLKRIFALGSVGSTALESNTSNSGILRSRINYSDRKLFVVFFVMMTALVVENSFSQVSDKVTDQIASFWGLALFVTIAAVYAVGQFFMLEIVKSKTRQRISSSSGTAMRTSESVITIVQYVLTSVVVFIILQMLFSSQYYKDLLLVPTTITLGFVIFLTILLSKKLLSWYKMYRQPIVLLFGLAAAGIVVFMMGKLIWHDSLLLARESVIFPGSQIIWYPDLEEGSPLQYVLLVLHQTLTVFTLLLWAGAVLLLYHNFRRVGKARFWILIGFPIVSLTGHLVYYYLDIGLTNVVADPMSPPGQLLATLFLFYSGIAVGIVIGLGFVLIGRFLKQGADARAYMIIAGLGFMMFSNTSISAVFQTPYPPYGIASLSSLPLSMFMIVVGLSYSAISVSQDQTLRQIVRKSAKDMKFLESIGRAQMEQEMKSSVMQVFKTNAETLTEQSSGVQPSLSEEEIRQYLDQVIEQVRLSNKPQRG
jgi:hypothetical protein